MLIEVGVDVIAKGMEWLREETYISQIYEIEKAGSDSVANSSSAETNTRSSAYS